MHSLVKKVKCGTAIAVTSLLVTGASLATASDAVTPANTAIVATASSAQAMHRSSGAPVAVPAPGKPPSTGIAPPGSTIVVLGDSLSAEYGLTRDAGWVHLLQQRLATPPNHYNVSNASISGDTTSGGLSRLPAVLKRLQPSIVIVELGGNDALRGLPITLTRQNLQRIIELSQAAGARVLLVGMQIPPNYGAPYTRAFEGLYPELAKRYSTSLVPFLLEGIADKPELFQADQIHPLPKAEPVLLENVWKRLQAMVSTTSSARR